MQTLRSSRFFLTCLAAALFTFAGCASGDRTGTNGNAGGNRTGATSAWSVASLISGTYQAEGSDLRLDIRGADTPVGSEGINLFATAAGRYGERNVREQGVVHIENQAGDVLLAYIPRFDPTITALSPGATDVTASEVRAACTVYLGRSGQGYSGRTSGTTSCAQAIGGAVGDWAVEVQPGMIRFSTRGQQPIVFRKAEGAAR
ncbi:MAG TPA: hypothetical protein VJ725_04045 [Thermoanaerobaculia bacterium]|nr:hypothetical protein [Thermoanaerobaculia bacterium]